MPPGAKRKGKATIRGYSGQKGDGKLWLPTTTTTNSKGKTTTTRGVNTQQARRIVGDSGIKSLKVDLAAQSRDRSQSPVSSTVHSSGAVQAKGRKPSLKGRRKK